MQTITKRGARVFSETDTEKGWSEAPPDESASGCGCFIRRQTRFVMQPLLSFQFPFVSDAKIKAQYIRLCPTPLLLFQEDGSDSFCYSVPADCLGKDARCHLFDKYGL